jgi:YebC/PmpR family DNA-binding regulatory protein
VSGHSKWSTIKRKKGLVDAKRGKIFTKIGREITTAVRLGGGDAEANPRLRMALTAANAANMPKDNQERAVKKGLGELGDGVTVSEVVYEGRGPGGVSFVIECMTDNKNRTVGEIRHMFAKGGGEMGTDGSATYMFDRRGVISLAKTSADEDTIMERVLEADADEFEDAGEHWVVLCGPSSLHDASGALSDLSPESAEVQWLAKPEYAVPLDGEKAVAVAQFWNRLDEHEDVQGVFTNAEIDDAVLEEHGP